MSEKTSLGSLFSAFFRIGIMTFGGGMAMLPMLERECVQSHSWATEEQMLDYFAVGQCTPGIIAVNVATFIGYKERGILGGIVATLGVVTPSFLIITLLASVIRTFSDNVYVAKAFRGIRVAVCALILNALIKLAKKAIKGWVPALIAVLSLALQLFLGVSPVIIVILAISYGLVIFFCNRKNPDSPQGAEKQASSEGEAK